jgi:TolA-binding protein
MRRIIGTIAALCFAVPLVAQEAPEPEVRRAIPVNPGQPEVRPALPAPVQQPAWLERVTPRQPEGRIEVLQPENPPPGPQEIPDSEIPTAPAVSPDDDPNSIRLTPQGVQRDAAQELLDKANSIYARKMYDFAAIEYEKFLAQFPSASGRDAALFRLGECYRADGDARKSRETFEKLATEFKEGEFLGAGAYRLGEMLFADSKYEAALREFSSAIQNAGSLEVRLSAKYQAARCLDRLGRGGDAIPLFREVVAVEENNPYRDYAKVALAGALAAGGQKPEARSLYEEVADGGGPTLLKAEATVKAGALAAEAGDKTEAAALFEEARTMEEAGQWKGVAFLGLVRLYASTGNTKKLTAISEEDLKLLNGEYRAEVISAIASAHRQSGSNLKALEYFNRLAKEFPKTKAARQARFTRVVAMHELSDKRTKAELEAFLKDAEEPSERDRGNLLLAEILFQEEKYADAAKSYGAVLESGLSEDLKRQATFKYAWCLARSGNNPEAIKFFTEFLEKYPDSELSASAYAQRGVARQALKEYQPALVDLQTVIDKWPKSQERELALQQKALLLGQMENYPEMKTAFLQLIEEYPKTRGVAQAEYWIGWADFEQKDYKAAIPRLKRARQLEPATYGDRAGIRIALAYYYTENRTALIGELAALKPEALPADVYRWLGLRSAQESDFAAAEKALSLAAAGGSPDPEVLIVLAESRNALGKHSEAMEAVNLYIAKVPEPSAKARGLIVMAESKRGLKDYDGAARATEEALLLQPEGRLNAVGRMTAAEILFSKGNYEEAAKGFLSVALLYEDPAITPRALARAADSYSRANNETEAAKATEELNRRFPDFSKTTPITSKTQ